MILPRKAVPFTAVLLVVTFLSSLFAAVPDAGDDRYLPLAEGAEWTMDLHITTLDGREIRGTMQRVISVSVERNGKQYLHSTTTLRPSGFPPQSYAKLVRKDATGFHSIKLSVPDAKEQTEIPFPLKVGMTWEIQSSSPLKQTVVAKESVTIGDKTYADCFRIHAETKDGKFVEDFWEAPGIGLVKSEFTQNGAKFKMTLRDYTLGKTASKSLK